MTVRRLLSLVGVAVVLTVLVGGSVIVRSLLWPRDPDSSLRLVDGRRVGEAIGYIVRIEAERRTLQVSESHFGLRPLNLVVGDDATILIRDKEGGLGDLVPDMPVRVVYERTDGARRAISVEILAPIGGRAPRSTPWSPPATAATLPRKTAPGASDAGAQRSAARDLAPVASSPAVAAPRPDKRRSSIVKPALAPAASIDPTKQAPAADPPSPRVTDEGAGDGSAAIDWLLNRAGRH